MADQELPNETVTQWLQASAEGSLEARDRLIGAIYGDLRRLAQALMLHERPDHTLQATALVNELLVKVLSQGESFSAESRKQLMALAAVSMRRLLVDHARTRTRTKRGGGQEIIPIQTDLDGATNSNESLLLIHDALDRLKQAGERQATVAELRIFGGFTAEEIADVIGVTTRTVERDWLFARAWLQSELR